MSFGTETQTMRISLGSWKENIQTVVCILVPAFTVVACSYLDMRTYVTAAAVGVSVFIAGSVSRHIGRRTGKGSILN
jgi:hypothetical protein